MYKENGRVGSSEKREKANTIGKIFVCPDCGEERSISNVEFGVDNRCEKCAIVMMEKNV